MQKANNTATNAQQKVRPPPALDPERMGLVQPWKEFVSRGWVKELNSTFTPTGTNIVVTLSDEIDKNAVKIAPGLAKQIIIDSGKWSPRATGKGIKDSKKTEPARPKKSLIKKDFEDGAEKVKERALAVAKALGSTTAKGRIGSQKLMIEEVDTFEGWWKVAPASAKIKLFTDKKHLESLDKDDIANFGKLMNGKCPFRGSVPTPKEEESDLEEDEKKK